MESPSQGGVFYCSGEYSLSYPPAMTFDTKMTLALLQELLLALRANYAGGFKGWMALGLEELGRPFVVELIRRGDPQTHIQGNSEAFTTNGALMETPIDLTCVAG